ncbi:acyltransferase [Microbacter sp. GSS18]|nr:acyltransferase [Microbacter sp. GSS18]
MPVTSSTARRIEGLDLLRGIAILLVIVRHSWPDVFGGAGIVGVVTFFALSGYLITGLLVDDLRRYGRVRYGRFYFHRAVRLLPALAMMLVVFAMVDGVFDWTGRQDLVPRSLLLGITYTMNIPGTGETNGAVNHLWTLATEEQFYLVWPLVLVLGIRLRKLRLAVIASGTVLLVALGTSLLVVAPGYDRVYAWPTTWAVSMVIGAAAQLGKRKVMDILDRSSRRARMSAGMALGCIVLLSFAPDAKSQWWLYFVLGLLTSAATVVLIFFLTRWEIIPVPWLRPLLWLGIISYAAYLWNKPIVVWLAEADLGDAGPLLSAAATLVAATISWYAVERPANRLRKKLDSRSQADSVGVATHVGTHSKAGSSEHGVSS